MFVDTKTTKERTKRKWCFEDRNISLKFVAILSVINLQYSMKERNYIVHEMEEKIYLIVSKENSQIISVVYIAKVLFFFDTEYQEMKTRYKFVSEQGDKKTGHVFVVKQLIEGGKHTAGVQAHL